MSKIPQRRPTERQWHHIGTECAQGGREVGARRRASTGALWVRRSQVPRLLQVGRNVVKVGRFSFCLKCCINCRGCSARSVRVTAGGSSFVSCKVLVFQAVCTCLCVVMVRTVRASVGGQQPHPAQTRSRPATQFIAYN